MQNKALQPFPLSDQKIIDAILEKVHKVCLFGSTNSPNKEEELMKNEVAQSIFKMPRM